MVGDALRGVEVRKTYRTRGGPAIEALRGVSLSIRRGERIALLGRNGAGKTTFLRIASTLLMPSGGTVEVFGHDVAADPDAVRPLIAVVPQEGKPFFHLTPREQVYAYLRARGLPRDEARERTAWALGQVGLEEAADRLAITLSGGQKQRTMVATVLATRAPLLFLDEPTIGLDPFGRRGVWESLRQLTREGSTILLTTHYLDEAEALSDRVYIVEEGRVLAEGTAEDLKHRVGGTIRVSVKDGVDLADQLATFGSAVSEDGTVHVVTNQARVGELVDLAMRHGLSATVGPVTLEEAFLRVVGRSINEE